VSTELPPVLPANALTPVTKRYAVTLKLLVIALVVLLLHIPLGLINGLRQERQENRAAANASRTVEPDASREAPADRSRAATEQAPVVHARDSVFGVSAVEGYRMVYRALKYSVLVLGLVFTAFFLFETLAALRLHVIHYTLVGAAMCLFYLALLALGEVVSPGLAYLGAAVASSLMIVLYSAAILRSYARASGIAVLLAAEHSVLYVVLRMEDYALLAGTATLFVALGALMYFTRHVDWFSQESGRSARA
jgi:inner membrane protein involved in colicin E2 resistance